MAVGLLAWDRPSSALAAHRVPRGAPATFLALVVDLAIVLRPRAAVNRHGRTGSLEEPQHVLRRAPQCRALTAHDDRPLDDDGIVDHARDDLLVGQAGTIEARFGRLFLAQ